MAAVAQGTDSRDRVRFTALRHAQEIEEKKKLQARIADLVVDAFDLPSDPSADPAHPSGPDLKLFKECLRLFQPTDLDDLVYERNVDDRCGYALCSKPNKKINHGGDKVWNRMTGKDFKFVSKADMERWCSTLCGERTIFIRAQLSTEPAWLRDTPVESVKLLDDVRKVNGVEDALAVSIFNRSMSCNSDSKQNLSLNEDGDADVEMTEKLQALSFERGKLNIHGPTNEIALKEKNTNSATSRPPRRFKDQQIEGHQLKKVRFAEQDSDGSDESDT